MFGGEVSNNVLNLLCVFSLEIFEAKLCALDLLCLDILCLKILKRVTNFELVPPSMFI